MCGPCSDGTYWNSNDYQSYNRVKPDKERCEGCDEPINLCHCILSLDRIDKEKELCRKKR